MEARFDSISAVAGGGGLEMVLIGGRRFELIEAKGPWPPEERLFDAKVRWLVDNSVDAAAAGELERSEALSSRVGEWVRLVRETGRERQPDQIATLLGDLGPMPDAEDADERALWVAALINPLPALGVALEIRPAALAATSVLERLEGNMPGIKSMVWELPP